VAAGATYLAAEHCLLRPAMKKCNIPDEGYVTITLKKGLGSATTNYRPSNRTVSGLVGFVAGAVGFPFTK